MWRKEEGNDFKVTESGNDSFSSSTQNHFIVSVGSLRDP